MDRIPGICDKCEEPRTEDHDLLRCYNIFIKKVDRKLAMDDKIFKDMQKRSELWTDPEKEDRNDKKMRWGMAIGAVVCVLSGLAGYWLLGFSLFVLICILAASFMED